MMSDDSSQHDQDKTMKKISAQFIHDIATPLSIIQILANTLETYLPALLSAHQELKRQGSNAIDISQEDHDLLENSATRIKILTQQVNKTTKEYWETIDVKIAATDSTQHLQPIKHRNVFKPNNNLRVLVVEDDAIHQKIAHKLLSSEYHVDLASNGLEAVELCSKRSYDLILMDLHMPVMGGQQAVTKILQQKDFSALIIGLTNRPLGSEKMQLLEQGFNGFLEKPLNIEELNTIIKKMADISEIGEPH